MSYKKNVYMRGNTAVWVVVIIAVIAIAVIWFAAANNNADVDEPIPGDENGVVENGTNDAGLTAAREAAAEELLQIRDNLADAEDETSLEERVNEVTQVRDTLREAFVDAGMQAEFEDLEEQFDLLIDEFDQAEFASADAIEIIDTIVADLADGTDVGGEAIEV